MARWTCSLDVLADLNTLSKFSAGYDCNSDIPIVPYSSYGRGSSEDKLSRQPSPLLNVVEDDDVQLQQSFEPGAGRGNRILALSRYQQDVSLQHQLRMAMGRGYSNELIEDFIHKEVSSDPGQFSNAEVPGCSSQEGNSSCEATPDHAPPSAEPLKVENTDAVTSRKVPKSKNSVRRNRNALLNSLANFNKELAPESDSRNEIKTYPWEQDHNSCDCALTPTGSVHDHFKNKSKCLLTAKYGLMKRTSGFELRDEEFPPL